MDLTARSDSPLQDTVPLGIGTFGWYGAAFRTHLFSITDVPLKVEYNEAYIVPKKLLCCGCSFTKRTNSDISFSYCDYLQSDHAEIINIGQGGSGIGISLLQVNSFLQQPCDHLTHFIFQVPSPARQPVKIAKDFSEAYLRRFRCSVESLVDDQAFIDDDGVWSCLVKNDDPRQIEFLFLNKIEYYTVCTKLIGIITDKLLNRYPDLKIIFIRYEKTNSPLVYEFSKHFFAKTLSEFCKENNITYIYKKNFHTEYFRKHKLTYDATHPNETGSRLIAETIEEYL